MTKRHIPLRSLFLIPGLAGLLTASLLVLSGPARADEMTFDAAIEPSFPPFSYQDQGEAKGIAIDIMKAVAKDQGFSIHFMALPFPSIIPALTAGKIQIIADGLSVTKTRAKRIDYTIPWFESNDVIVAPEDSDVNVFTAVCCGHKLGVQGGSSQQDWIEKNAKNVDGINFDEATYSDYVTMVTDMLNGRIPAADLPETTAQQLINKGRPIKIVGKIYIRNPVAFAVKKGDPHHLLARINRGLVNISKSGEMAKIVHRYIPGFPVGKVPAGRMPSFVNTYKKPVPGLSGN